MVEASARPGMRAATSSAAARQDARNLAARGGTRRGDMARRGYDAWAGQRAKTVRVIGQDGVDM